MGGYNNPPYYLSAYSLAVKQGFVGTEQQWLDSLKGDGVQLRNADGKIQWRHTKKDHDPEDGWQDLWDVSQIQTGGDISYFGWRYADAAAVYDLNEEGTVKMYLFPTGDGYDAVVTGEGAIRDHNAPKKETQNPNGLIDVTITDNREYSKYVEQIRRLHIAAGVNSIGNHFMHGAYNLKHLVFEDSTQITHLGTNAFAATQIGGVYEFPELEDTTLNGPFESCPKLEGLTFSNTVKTIAARAFGRCLGLRYVDGLIYVTKIEDAAFMYCTSLERLGVTPANVELGKWAFILTPNEAAADGVALATAGWRGKGDLCFVQNEWDEQLDAIQNVTAEKVSFPIPESDSQGTDFYNQWGVFPLLWKKNWYSGGQRASACCGIFCLYHIYNIRHPNAQYDTFYDFIQNEIAPKKIKVTQELRAALEASTYWPTLNKNCPGVYEVGREITALDLPTTLEDEGTTWGGIGTSHWGVCEVLGWDVTNKRLNEYSGADAKQLILDELHAGRPVQMVIIGDDTIGHGRHSVVAIGYEPAEDKLQIIDSRGRIPADTSPMVYWLPFEALITPHKLSFVQIFNFGEEITMYGINKDLKVLMDSVNSGFRMEKGTEWGYVPASGNTAARVTIPCSPNPNMIIVRAGTDTAKIALAGAAADPEKDAGGYEHRYFFGAILLNKDFVDFDTVSLGESRNLNSVMMAYVYYSAGIALPVTQELIFENLDTVPRFAVNEYFVREYQNEAGETVPAEYEWTAYYWKE